MCRLPPNSGTGIIRRMRITMVGTFGMQPKMTMTTRALAMGQALARHGHEVTLVVPPWNWPEDSGREWVDGGVRVVNIALPGSGVRNRCW